MLYRCWWNIILKYVQYHQLYGLIWTISFKSPNFLVTKKNTGAEANPGKLAAVASVQDFGRRPPKTGFESTEVS